MYYSQGNGTCIPFHDTVDILHDITVFSKEPITYFVDILSILFMTILHIWVQFRYNATHDYDRFSVSI
jgi:hypothetical protein